MQCIFIMESIDPLMPISYIVIKDKNAIFNWFLTEEGELSCCKF